MVYRKHKIYGVVLGTDWVKDYKHDIVFFTQDSANALRFEGKLAADAWLQKVVNTGMLTLKDAVVKEITS